MLAAYLLAVATGLVAAGFMGSLWAAVIGARLVPYDLIERDLFTPFRVLALVFNAPLMLLEYGAHRTLDGRVLGPAAIAAGLGWSFMQGVLILTQVFGFA